MVSSRSYAGFAVVSADAVDILKRICHFECCSSTYGYGVRILCKVDDCYLLNATTSYNAIIINRCRHLQLSRMFVPFDGFLDATARLWRLLVMSHTIEVKIDFYLHVTCLHKRGVVDTDFKS
uniref:Uncharacterized protein n=1 Tax=Glossina austeni TaxID=7395 RepID=A0A1A9UYV7_GLOAU